MATTTKHGSRSDPAPPRNSPYLPTPLERLAVSVYPLILIFGAVFSLVSPETRAAPYDAGQQAHAQSEAPSYFARKANVFNVVFVKRGWGWTTFAFVFFVLGGLRTSSASSSSSSSSSSAVVDRLRLQAFLRWGCATAWWVCVTQWCFGPPLIDRGFRWSGGKCEGREEDGDDFFLTSVACRAAGGRWRGGHDISGHVFLLVLGSLFLVQEVAWPVLRARRRDERCVFMGDGAVKGAGVEAGGGGGGGGGGVEAGFGVAAKTALGVVAMKLWMLLMTAIYFHTWFEKFTGLATALAGAYGLYIVPRFVPAAIKVPKNLAETARTIFARAKSEGALTFYPTKAAVVSVGAVPFQLRFSHALVKKPKPKTSPAPSPSPAAAVDPFANPPRSLYVTAVGEAHYLVLNKFAIVAEHLILATNDFEPQTGLLGVRDVEATLACLRCYGEGGLFAFFNCGIHSGASQPHRHVQLLPIEGMREGLVASAGEARWEPLIERQSLLDAAPFVSFGEDIGADSSPADVHAAYLRLYRKACRALLGVGDADEQVDGEARVSYNMAMTAGRIVVCPRRAEGEGDVAVNGALLAGTALVKSEEVWDALVAEPDKLGEVLGRVGVARG
ncbi:hypothetical protein CP532_6917 [Ophiocordyceps camponoti-leonardi (nom. inval.)]|nr:hypothetical protein CP532_6917 [Ophiocordyceps camponoti-leonardi (nom. inval.)]